jgi:hypothetical protein
MTAPSSSSSSSSLEPNDARRLLRRFHLEDDIVFDHQQHQGTSSDNDNVHPMVQALGDVLTMADLALADITSDQLGTALLRTSRDLAQAVGHVADHLESQSDQQRRALAEAICEDNHNNSNNNRRRMIMSQQPWQQQQHEQEEWTTEDMIVALSGASSLLRDIQVGLQGMEPSEAEEIATVVLTLARLFVASLKGFHSSLLLQHHEDDEQQPSRFELILEQQQDNNSNSSSNSTPKAKIRQQQQQHRLRVLWPSLGPAVLQACQWGKDQSLQHPILAIALGMTLWPAAVMTALIGTPMIVVDTMIQHAYHSYQESPVVQSIETTAFSLQQAAKLTWMCTQLVTRQFVRVAQLQIQRQGGIGAVAQSCVAMAWDRVLHPVETVTTVWQGLQWSCGALHDQWKNQFQCHHYGDQGYDATPANTWQQ